MNEKVLIAILGILGSILSAFIGYFLGKKKKIDELRLNQAFPRAEEISTLMQDIYHSDISFAEWWKKNFGHLENIQQGINYFEELDIYRDTGRDIISLHDKRNRLRQHTRIARIYLNQKVLDDIEKYLEIDSFSYSHDGMGGILFTSFWGEFFLNLLDEEKSKERKKLYRRIKNRFNKMHNV